MQLCNELPELLPGFRKRLSFMCPCSVYPRVRKQAQVTGRTWSTYCRIKIDLCLHRYWFYRL